jgi:flagellar motor switch protein FliN/FliY
MSDDDDKDIEEMVDGAGGASEEESMADDWAAAMEEQVETEAEADAESVGFEEFDQNTDSGVSTNPELEIILDIPVTISMEVGSTAITIRNLLQLNQGSVIELDRLAGEPLNVLVNGTLIAHGEVVVVNEKFGIRMTDVISPSERIKKLA